MVHLRHISDKQGRRILIKENDEADIILNSSLGHKYIVIKQDKPVDTPPEVMEKVSIKPKTQEKVNGKLKKNADR